MILIEEENSLAHYGTPRHSGRYPWGSGGMNEARSRDFLGYISDMKKQGMSEQDIAKGVGMTTTQLRQLKTIAINERKQADITRASRLFNTGMSYSAVGREMGINESSVRALLNPTAREKADILGNTTSVLKDAIDSKGFIDVGVGVEHYLGVSRSVLDTAILKLKNEGYIKHYIKIDQLGTKYQTTLQIMSKPGVPWKDVNNNLGKITQVMQYSPDGGKSFTKIHPPVPIDSKRVGIVWGEEGGAHNDGVIYIRPDVDDISLGSSKYAQVRIAVDGTHYIKGMAVYKDDLPKGVDVQFNTNKLKSDTGGDKLKALKPYGPDPNQPYTAVVGRQHGVMNILNEEGDWDKWGRTLSSQMLSKQKPSLAKQQLDMTYEGKKNEFDEIMKLTNPTVRKTLLEKYADSVDSSAVHLEAAGLPRTAAHVLIPMNSMKPGEIYAPNYDNGDKVVLIRHPHGGPFEIPELVVNNKNRTAKAIMGNAKDAIGIHHSVAEKLSGADFDGDAVLVIPNNKSKVVHQPALTELKNFNPKVEYKKYDGMKVMTSRETQIEMGKISNLITDMSIKGAPQHEIAAAVRHSMVVIDAEKHELNYKQSALDNNIVHLKTQWQGKGNAGASTLVSRAESRQNVPERKQGFTIDKTTGEKVYRYTGASYPDKKGNIVEKMTESTKLAETPDAHTLSSGTAIEKIYADHSNKLKALANQARKEAVNTKGIVHDPNATKTHASSVKTLDAKLNLALRNAPLERQAQILGNAQVNAKKHDDPNMPKETLKKVKNQALETARYRTGAGKSRIEISVEEWAAIQAGAITKSKLEQILQHSDLKSVKQHATPKSALLMTSSKKARAATMLASGYTQAEVAAHLGVSLTTLKNSLT